KTEHVPLNLCYIRNSFTQNIKDKSLRQSAIGLYKALGFDVFSIDGHNLKQIESTLRPLRTSQKKPVFIIANTQIGRGLLYHQGTLSAHNHLQQVAIKSLQQQILPSYQPWQVDHKIYKFFQKKTSIYKR
ncbi:MAG: hypothetical protein ACRYGR_06780, partial [Janthinobacterium lividum]